MRALQPRPAAAACTGGLWAASTHLPARRPRPQASFGTFKADCEAQLAEEERRCLPLMRRSFSCEELRPVEARMLGGQSLAQQAAFFHSMDEETREAYFRQAQTPWLVARLVILPKVHQYDRYRPAGGGIECSLPLDLMLISRRDTAEVRQGRVRRLAATKVQRPCLPACLQDDGQAAAPDHRRHRQGQGQEAV